jgi:hypothetical protein
LLRRWSGGVGVEVGVVGGGDEMCCGGEVTLLS